MFQKTKNKQKKRPGMARFLNCGPHSVRPTVRKKWIRGFMRLFKTRKFLREEIIQHRSYERDRQAQAIEIGGCNVLTRVSMRGGYHFSLDSALYRKMVGTFFKKRCWLGFIIKWLSLVCKYFLRDANLLFFCFHLLILIHRNSRCWTKTPQGVPYPKWVEIMHVVSCLLPFKS